MDVLTNKTAKTSNYYSRYNGFYYYYNKLDNKNQMSTSRWISHNNANYSTYVVKEGDTYDSIALWFYNNPTYYWIICDFNRILNPMSQPSEGDILYIPNLGSGFTYEKY